MTHPGGLFKKEAPGGAAVLMWLCWDLTPRLSATQGKEVSAQSDWMKIWIVDTPFFHPRSLETSSKCQGIRQNGEHGVIPCPTKGPLHLHPFLLFSPSDPRCVLPTLETKHRELSLNILSQQCMCSKPRFSSKTVFWEGQDLTKQKGQEDGIRRSSRRQRGTERDLEVEKTQ